MRRTWIRARRLRHEATCAERRLWHCLRRQALAGFKFRRQYPVAGYIADFACLSAKLIVELDGGQHIDDEAYDAKRTLCLEHEGYRVLRFWNDDALLRTNEVLTEILRHLEKNSGA